MGCYNFLGDVARDIMGYKSTPKKHFKELATTLEIIEDKAHVSISTLKYRHCLALLIINTQ